MNVEFVPLLAMQRSLQQQPPSHERFLSYLGTVLTDDRQDVRLFPLLFANPMAKEHVTALLDELLSQNVEQIAAEAVHDACATLKPGARAFKAGLAVVDDRMGGWTNRFATDYQLRFGSSPFGDRFWITGALWSSEPANVEKAAETIRLAVFRTAYIVEHGMAETLADRLSQEGWAMARAGCEGPTLEPDEREYVREVIAPFLPSTDMRTTIECLFGDAAASTLGFSALGLAGNAGLALALHDAKREQEAGCEAGKA